MCVPHLSVSREQRGDTGVWITWPLAANLLRLFFCRFSISCVRSLLLNCYNTTRVCGGICHASPIFAPFSLLPRFIISIIPFFFWFSGKRWRKSRSAVFLMLTNSLFSLPFLFSFCCWNESDLSDDSRSKGGRRGETRCRVLISPCHMYKQRNDKLRACVCDTKTWLPTHTHTPIYILLWYLDSTIFTSVQNIFERQCGLI